MKFDAIIGRRPRHAQHSTSKLARSRRRSTCPTSSQGFGFPRFQLSSLAFTSADWEDIRVQDRREEIERWEGDNAEHLCRLASLLHELVSFARTSRTHLEI